MKMKLNNNYSKNTKDIIKNSINYLKTRYGEVKPEWECMLTLFADNLELYQEVTKSIKENGVYNTEKGLKNPLLSTQKDLQATIFKQVQHLGLSPYAASKIKQAEEDDSNLLSAIMGEGDDE